jgi:hypothetical protein
MSQKFLSPVKLSGISTGSILKVDSNGVIVAAVSGTDYITSSTASQWTTTGNDIYYNTGNVGIGETSPDGLLHIKGSSQATEFHIESSTGTASTSGAIKIAQNNRSAEDFAGEMVFYVQDNNVGGTYWREAMAIINSGNIAIGSTDPGNYRLKVTGSANITGAVTLSNYGAGFLKADANGLLSVDTSTYITGYTETDTLDSVTDRGATTTNTITVGSVLISATAPILDFVDTNSFTDTNDRFRVRAVGNAGRIQWYDSSASSLLDLMHFSMGGDVGIGTTSPGARLEVKGDGSSVDIFRVRYNDSYYTDYSSNQLNFTGSNQAYQIKNNGSAVITINASSNVGIGTTSPGAKLHVEGNAFFNPYHPAVISGGGAPYYGANITLASDIGATAGAVRIWSRYDGTGYAAMSFERATNSQAYGGNPTTLTYSEVMRISGTGNVGIGTTSPTYKLDITGTVNFLSGTNDITYLRVGNNLDRQLLFSNFTNQSRLNAGHRINASDSSGAIALATAGSDRLFITPTGNVGIGTTAPASTLHVSGTIRVDNIIGETYPSNTFIDFDYDETAWTNSLALGSIGSVFYLADTNNNSASTTPAHQFFTGTTDIDTATALMTIRTDGNVGIGTTSPTSKLTVEDTIGIKRAGVDAISTLQQTGAGLEVNAPNGYHPLIIKHNGTELVRFKNDGNVGIGTTSPGAKLHVYSSSSGASAYALNGVEIESNGVTGINILSPNTGYGRIYFGAPISNTAGAIEYIHNATLSSGYMKLRAGGGDRVFIHGNGNVGINTGSPEDKLHVLVTSTSAAQGIYLDSGNGSAGSAYLNVSTTNGPVLTGNTTPAGLAREAYKASRMQFNSLGFKFEHSAENTTNAARTWSTHMVINASGDVGIGTTSPSTKLHVDGTITALGIKTENLPTVIDNSGIEPAQGEVEDIVQFKWSGTEVASIDTGGYVTATGYKTGGTTGFLKSDGSVDTSTYLSSSTLYSTIAFTINGNDVEIGDEVSIGSGLSFNDTTYTISSSDTLDSVTGRGATTTNGIAVGNITVNSSGVAASYIYLLSSPTGESELRMGDTDTDAGSIAYNNANNFMAFRTNAAEKVRITSAGNVGIGTTSPNRKLTVVGNGTLLGLQSDTVAGYSEMEFTANGVNGAYFFKASAGYSSYGGAGAMNYYNFGSHAFHSNSVNNILHLTAAGNVGIGTTSPASSLQVGGTSGSNFITLSGANTNGEYGINWSFNQPGTNIYSQVKHNWNDRDTKGLQFNTQAGYRFSFNAINGTGVFQGNLVTILGTGNVGIGTTSPGYKLDILGKVGFNTDGTMLWGNAFDYGKLTWDTGKAIVRGESGKALSLGANGTQDYVYITTTGNVGIGTTSPISKLNLNGGTGDGASYDAIFSLTRTSSTGNQLSSKIVLDDKDTNWGKLIFKVKTTASVAELDAYYTDAVTIDNQNANVGIGTTTPAYKLDVAGEGKVTGKFRVGGAVMLAEPGTGVLLFGSEGGNQTAIYSAGAEVIRINTAGNVGIGTTSPSEKLDVSGNIKTSGIVYVSATASTALRPAANDWIDIAEMGYGENHGKIAFEWNALSAPSSAHHGWFEIEVGTYYSASFNYGQDTYVELTKALAHNDFWLSAVRAVDYGSTVRIQVQVGRAVTAGTFRSFVLHKNQGTVTSLTPAINNNSYTVLALANVGDVDGDYVQKAIGNRARFSKSVAFDDKVGIGTTSPNAKLEVYNGTSRFWHGGTSHYTEFNNSNEINAYASNGTISGMYLNWAPGGSVNIARSAIYAQSAGNVGIGTTSPETKLHLYEASASPTLLTLHNHQSDIVPNGTQGNFIDFKMTDTNATFTPQVRIGMIVKDSDGDGGVISEGTGNFVIYTAEGTNSTGGGSLNEHLRVTDKGNVGIGTTSPSYKLDVNGSFNATNDISTSSGNVVVQNGAGIYSIKSTIGTSTSGTAFRIANTNDVQAVRVTFVAETANYQVAKIYEVVKAGTADPVAFKVVDTGPGGEEDFSVSFSNDGGDLLCTVTNDSANESLTLVTTIFVGGSNTSQTVSNS